MSQYIHNNVEFDKKFIELYPHYPNKELAPMIGINVFTIRYHAKRLKVKKTRSAIAKAVGCTDWNNERIQFLKDNFFKMTNQQLADQLGLTLTVVRNKTKLLGLKNYDLQYWTPEQTQYVVDRYQVLGDTEMAEDLQQRWPREKPWTRKVIRKKRMYLNLHRTKAQTAAIVARHSVEGGRSYTIRSNSASKNLPDRYVATCITRDQYLKAEILKQPVLIDLKRQQLRLNKAIREVNNAKV